MSFLHLFRELLYLIYYPLVGYQPYKDHDSIIYSWYQWRLVSPTLGILILCVFTYVYVYIGWTIIVYTYCKVVILEMHMYYIYTISILYSLLSMLSIISYPYLTDTYTVHTISRICSYGLWKHIHPYFSYISHIIFFYIHVLTMIYPFHIHMLYPYWTHWIYPYYITSCHTMPIYANLSTPS